MLLFLFYLHLLSWNATDVSKGFKTKFLIRDHDKLIAHLTLETSLAQTLGKLFFSRVERGKKSSLIQWWWEEYDNHHDYLLVELRCLATPMVFFICCFIWHSYPKGAGTIAPFFFVKKLKNKQGKGIDWNWSWSTFKGKSLIRSWDPRVWLKTQNT